MDTRNIVLATMILFFLTLEVLIGLDFLSKNKQLIEFRSRALSDLVELHEQIGYVGLLHNFKNSFLRPREAKYLDAAIANHQNALVEIDEIEAMATNFLGRPIKMLQARKMVNAYRERLDLLPNLIKKNKSAYEIDNIVRYDDDPASKEIKKISKIILLEMDHQFIDILNKSLMFGFFALVGLVASLVATIRYYFRAQQNALQVSYGLNEELAHHRQELLRSQKAIVSVMGDMQEEKIHTTKLNEQLSIKNQEMDRFIYTVSHDLKSPLVTIGGFSEILASELDGHVSEKQMHRLKRIQINVENMEKLLSGLLDLSRIVQQEVSRSDIDVTEEIRLQCDVLEADINAAGAKLEIANEPHTIYANKIFFSQCVLNLLSNALRYRDTARPLIIQISTSQNEENTIVHIRDNGVGIAPKYHHLIFGIFQRLSTATEGTGVGLTIVKTMMEKQGGRISLESEFGVGSCFSLTFKNKKTQD